MRSRLAIPLETSESAAMLHTRFQLRIVSAILMFLVSPCFGQAILSPPFGLQWGDSPEKLISWAREHSLNTTITVPGKQPALRIVRIQPTKGYFPGTQARSVEGRFLSGKLFELAVHYSDATASTDAITAKFEALKKQVSIEHGTLLTNQQQRTVKDQFVTRTQSFHREPVKGLFILLAFTEVEDLLRKSKDAMFSLVYRNDNFREALQVELEKKQ